jgi:hypothetical protein
MRFLFAPGRRRGLMFGLVDLVAIVGTKRRLARKAEIRRGELLPAFLAVGKVGSCHDIPIGPIGLTSLWNPFLKTEKWTVKRAIP